MASKKFSRCFPVSGKIITAMPRSRPLPEEELEICTRLKEVREQFALSRVAIARSSGGDSSALIRVESRRVPLHYSVARWIWRGGMHLLNPVYLATGEGPRTVKYGLWLPPPEEINVMPSSLFSTVVARFFEDLRTLSEPDASQRLPLSWIREQQRFFDRQRQEIDAQQRVLESHSEWLTSIREAARWMHQKRSIAIQAAVVREREKKVLTDTSIPALTKPMRTLVTLRDDLRRLTAKPGAKTQLAKDLTAQLKRKANPIPLATLSRYLSGDMEPGGEVTLALLNWVEKHDT